MNKKERAARIEALRFQIRIESGMADVARSCRAIAYSHSYAHSAACLERELDRLCAEDKAESLMERANANIELSERECRDGNRDEAYRLRLEAEAWAREANNLLESIGG